MEKRDAAAAVQPIGEPDVIGSSLSEATQPAFVPSLLHLSPTGDELLGVWLPDSNGTPLGYYPAGEESDAATYAESVLLARTGMRWRHVVRSLVHVSPYVAWWARGPMMRPGSELDAAFARMRDQPNVETSGDDEHTTAAQRAAAQRDHFRDDAVALAACIVTDRPLIDFRPGRGMSRYARWLSDADNELLVAVVAGTDKREVVDEVLAYGLAWQQDRDLFLVLPKGACDLVLPRLPWIGTTVRVWQYDDEELDPFPRPVPSRAAVLEAVRAEQPRRARSGYVLTEQEQAWIEPLLTESVFQGLTYHAQGGYLSWHTHGLQVLRVQRTRQRTLRMEAGVRYSRPGPGLPTPLAPMEISGPVSPDQVRAVVTAIESVTGSGSRSLTSDQLEHRLQAGLAHEGGSTLGLSDLRREYPAYRGLHRRGFIDFLGWDAKGRFHVVETKVGHDPRVVLQALDYAIWVTAHDQALRTDLGLAATPTGAPPVLDLVLAPKPGRKSGGSQGTVSPAVNPYIAPQLEALAGDVKWNVYVVDEPAATRPAPVRVNPAALWMEDRPLVAPPVSGPRWATRVGAEVRAAAPTPLRAGVFHASANDALLPAARYAYEDLESRGLLHRYVLHARSSQAFALNLFAPLDHTGIRAVWKLLRQDVLEMGAPQFEWEDLHDRLAEASSRSPHRTQVDVVLRAKNAQGSRVAALIEVKLTEQDFGHCSAAASPDNPTTDVCSQGGLFGGQPDRCFQLQNHGRGRRAYDRYLDGNDFMAPQGWRDDGGCWLRTGRSQPMRNLALARLLLAEGEVDHVIYGLCAPVGHAQMWRRFDEFRAVFRDSPQCGTVALPAEWVAQLHADQGTALRRRYAGALSDA